MLRGWKRIDKLKLLWTADATIVLYWDETSVHDVGESLRVAARQIAVHENDLLVFCSGLTLRSRDDVYEYLKMLVRAGDDVHRLRGLKRRRPIMNLEVVETDGHANAIEHTLEGVHVVAEEIRLRTVSDVEALVLTILRHLWRVDALRARNP